MSLPRPGIRRRLRAAWRRLGETRHWLRLRRRLEADRPAEYREYLETQLRRSLSKRTNDPGVGARVLIDEVARHAAERRSAVLCVGCRNGVEIDEFRSRGFGKVLGIDLYSQREDIVVMDMHELTFPDDSFDVVYAAHALEHAYDVDTVVREIVRVAREGALVAVEVPVRFQGSIADRVVFSGLDELRELFRPWTADELLGEEQPPRSATNEQGSEIARVVIRLEKGEPPRPG